MIWMAAAIGSLVVGAVAARMILVIVNWGAVWAGWLVAVLSSLAAHLFNRRAVGRSRNAFVGWGLVANSFRMLTLIGIFAYMTFHHRDERASFFVTVFVSFFILMAEEIVSLFRAQNKVGGIR